MMIINGCLLVMGNGRNKYWRVYRYRNANSRGRVYSHAVYTVQRIERRGGVSELFLLLLCTICTMNN